MGQNITLSDLKTNKIKSKNIHITKKKLKITKKSDKKLFRIYKHNRKRWIW